MATLTTAQLAQQALNIAVPLQQSIKNGVHYDYQKAIIDLCACVILLAESVATSTNVSSSPASTQFAVGNEYGATQPTTAPTATKGR